MNRKEIFNRILTSVKGHNSVTIMQKMMCNNPNLDLASTNILQNLVKFYQFVLKILSQNKIMKDGQMK